jgi:Domain of unknown function (DUF4430)
VNARLVSLLAAALLAVAGCGGGAEGAAGEATLWVTRDRGEQVLLETRVDAGQTLLRALRSEADVETRYGGRFVQSIEGVEGSLAGQRDWFWFVNGIEGDRSAVEYRLRAGDVAWWDFRSWAGAERMPVVVGAFPEPFLHGWNGRVRPSAVRYAAGLAAPAARIAERLRAASVGPVGTPVDEGANLFVLEDGPPRFVAAERTPGRGAGSPVVFTFAGDVDALLEGRLGRRAYSLP